MKEERLASNTLRITDCCQCVVSHVNSCSDTITGAIRLRTRLFSTMDRALQASATHYSKMDTFWSMTLWVYSMYMYSMCQCVLTSYLAVGHIVSSELLPHSLLGTSQSSLWPCLPRNLLLLYSALRERKKNRGGLNQSNVVIKQTQLSSL